MIRNRELTTLDKLKIMQSPEYEKIMKQLGYIRSSQGDFDGSIYTIIPTKNENIVQFVVDVDALDDLKEM